MGKKKKKKKHYYVESSDKFNIRVADKLEAYVDAIDSMFILEGKNEKDVQKAIKIVREAIEDLRKGKVEKVFNMNEFDNYLERPDEL